MCMCVSVLSKDKSSSSLCKPYMKRPSLAQSNIPHNQNKFQIKNLKTVDNFIDSLGKIISWKYVGIGRLQGQEQLLLNHNFLWLFLCCFHLLCSCSKRVHNFKAPVSNYYSFPNSNLFTSLSCFWLTISVFAFQYSSASDDYYWQRLAVKWITTSPYHLQPSKLESASQMLVSIHLDHKQSHNVLI